MQTSARISDALARFEGLHILVFGAPDVEATVTRLAADGVVHGPITRVQRPGGPGPEAAPVPIDFVEIDDKPGLSPEGRLALVENWPADSPLLMGNLEHPNGALELIESVLCVPDSDLSAYERALCALPATPGAQRRAASGVRPRRVQSCDRSVYSARCAPAG
jgi:Glyoxalase-like domain